MKCGDKKAYENLANEIVLQAIDDFERRITSCRDNYNEKKDLAHQNACFLHAYCDVKETINFFKGDWIKILTNVPGEDILKYLVKQNEVSEQMKQIFDI